MFLWTPTAHAQDRGARRKDASIGVDAYVPAPKDRLYYTNASLARYNAIGLANTYQLGWRRRLSTRDHVLLRDTYSFVSGSTLRQMDADGESQAATGWALLAGFTLRAAVGPVAIRTTGNLQRLELRLPEDRDVAVYDLVWDRLTPNGGACGCRTPM